jgi:glycyl-tRNA synthetase
METLVSLCKRRGFIFQSSEIYGGTGSCWDYGPLGVDLKQNIKRLWWRDYIQRRPDMVGLDASILMHAMVWKASGHVDNFTDPMVDCLECRRRFRADKVDETPWVHYCAATKGNKFTIPAGEPCSHCGERRTLCPECGKGSLTAPRQFNLMFKTFMGPVEEDAALTYLRPETAQGIFVNFRNVCDTARVRVPFGIGQIGKAFRNEINPRNFTFRSREFEQMEIEFFCRPADAPAWYEYWRERRFAWYIGLGMRRENLHLREHDKSELAHYAAACADVEYDFPFGRSELEGIANRTDFDLRQHMQFSGKDLTFFDDQDTDPNTRRFLPYVIEPSAGADRGALAFLCDAYVEDQVGGEPRTVLKLHPRLAPIKAAVFPLVKKDGMPEKALEIYRGLRRRFNVFYDEKGAIGRRYRRQDEAGTPFCITIDGDTLSAGSVTVRERDSCEQVRVGVAELASFLGERLGL